MATAINGPRHVSADESNASVHTRSQAANAAAFTATDMYAVTGVGAPSYTSGAHIWNGTADTLKANPISSIAMPPCSRSSRPCKPPSAPKPITLKLVEPVAPYTSAIPYNKNPVENDP